MKHVTPPTDGTPVEFDLPTASIDAYSASPALRLRWQMLAAKASVAPAQPVLPPPVGEPRQEFDCDDNAVAMAFDDNNVLARLMMLRADAAAEIERLLTFLDETGGIVDDEDDEREAEPEHDEESHDDEPSLGSLSSNGGDQSRWGSNDTCQFLDAEDEHDGAEPDESGIADIDGYMEQCPGLFQHSDQRVS